MHGWICEIVISFLHSLLLLCVLNHAYRYKLTRSMYSLISLPPFPYIIFVGGATYTAYHGHFLVACCVVSTITVNSIILATVEPHVLLSGTVQY